MECIARDLEELRQIFAVQQAQLAAEAVPPVGEVTDTGTRKGSEGSDAALTFLVGQPSALAPDAAAAKSEAAAVPALRRRLAETTSALAQSQAELQAHQIALQQQTEKALAAAAARAKAEALWRSEEGKQQASEEALALARQQLSRLGRVVQSCEDDVHGFETQWDALATSLATLGREAEALREVNTALRSSLTAATQRCAQLDVVEQQRDLALTRVAALEEAEQARAAEWASLQNHFAEAQARVADGVAYWAAVRDEHAALRTALAVSQAQAISTDAVDGRTGAVAVLPLPHPSSPPPPPPLHVAGSDAGKEEEEEEEIRASEGQLLRCLEAKYVDLAIALQQAEQEAALSRTVLDARTTHTAACAATIAALTAALTTSQPAVQQLTEYLLPTQAAALATSEAVVAPLLEQYEHVVQLYAEECQHTHRLEVQLAATTAGLHRTGHAHDDDGGGAGAGAAASRHTRLSSSQRSFSTMTTATPLPPPPPAATATTLPPSSTLTTRPSSSRRQTFSFAAIQGTESRQQQQQQHKQGRR